MGLVFYLVCFSSFFQIKKISISGSEKIKQIDFQQLIENHIQKKILFFFSKSIFLQDFKKINNVLSEQFPSIEKLVFKKKIPDQLEIKIFEKKPKAIFCSLFPNFASQNLGKEKQEIAEIENCFFLDNKGIIFERTDQTDLEILKLEKKDINEEIKLGDKIIEENILSRISDVENEIKTNLKIPVEKIFFVSEEEVNIKTKQGWEIFFNLNEDINWQLLKLKTVLGKKIPLEKTKDLEYIELRFGNIASFKFKK